MGRLDKTSPPPNLGVTASLVEEMLWWFCSISFFNREQIQGDGGNWKELVYQSDRKGTGETAECTSLP